jgi:hypothetical protein
MYPDLVNGESQDYQVFAGGGVVTLEWYREDTPKPTAAELQAFIDSAAYAAAALQRQRESSKITRLQARLFLLDQEDPIGTHNNAWDAVIDWAQTQSPEVQAFFADAQTWKRLDPNVIAGASEFGWDDLTLDAVFSAAAQL